MGTVGVALYFFGYFGAASALFASKAIMNYTIRQARSRMDRLPTTRDEASLRLLQESYPECAADAISGWPDRVKSAEVATMRIFLLVSLGPMLVALAGFTLFGLSETIRPLATTFQDSPDVSPLILQFVFIAPVYALSAIVTRRYIRLIREFIAPYAIASVCEYTLIEAVSETGNNLSIMENLQRIELYIGRQVNQVTRVVPGINVAARSHVACVCRALDDLTREIATSGVDPQTTKKIVGRMCSISAAARENRICNYIDDAYLNEALSSDRDANMVKGRVYETLSAFIVFVVIVGGAAGVYVISRSDVIASAVLLLGAALFVVLLPRGSESLAWLGRLFPGSRA